MVRLRVLMIAALVALGSAECAPPRPTPPAVVNPPEPRHVTLLKQVHRAPRYTRALLEADLVAPDVEWWVAGDSVRLPWAGTRRGVTGIDDFSRILGQHMRYAGFEVREYLIAENRVAVVIYAHGTARATGRSFASEVVRVYDFRDGKIVRVRSFYDTGAYAWAMQAGP